MNKKFLIGIFQDFFRDSSLHFKGRLDDGAITMRELDEYIRDWVKKNFKYIDE